MQNPAEWSWADILEPGEWAALNSINTAWGLGWNLSGTPRSTLSAVVDWSFTVESLDPDGDGEFELFYRITERGKVTEFSGNPIGNPVVPTAIGDFAYLEELTLNSVSGLPESLGNLSTLKRLKMRGVTGSLPASIGSLVQLESMDLDDNSFSGGIPSGIGGLVNLEVLSMSGSSLSGPIPDAFQNLSELEILRLDHNNLTGSIPPSIGDLSSLTILEIRNNDLDGTIPASIGQLTGIDFINFTGNSLTGSIPDVWDGMTQLVSIDLSRNDLSGPIPASFGSLVNVQTLLLNGNALTGSIPASLGQMARLFDLNLSSNQLSGSIPNELGNLSTLAFLNLSFNQLSGSLPTRFEGMTSLVVLDLSYNQITGAIPDDFGADLAGADAIVLQYNWLSGPIPASLSQFGGSLLHLDFNLLSGRLPANLGSFGANRIRLGGNLFNPTTGSPSDQILVNLGAGAPEIVGFASQRAGGILIEGLNDNTTIAENQAFVKRLTLRNITPASISGTLYVVADPALGVPVPSPHTEFNLLPGEEKRVSFRLPTDTSGASTGTYPVSVSFEGAVTGNVNMTVATAPSINLGPRVGVVGDASGTVTATGADGVVRVLGLSDDFFQGDVIETGEDSTAELFHLDGSDLKLESESAVVVVEWQYDIDNAVGRSKHSLLRGIFRKTSGLIGRDFSREVEIEFLGGSLGIRGTEFSVNTFDSDSNRITEVEVFDGTVVFTDALTGEVTEIHAGETQTFVGPLPSLESVRYEVNPADGVSLDLKGYTDQAFIIQRSTNLVNWTNWRTVQASELPISLPESSPGDGVFYRLAR